MPNIPIEQQILPADHPSDVQMSIQAGKPVCGDDLLLAIEQINGQPLSEVARNLVRRAHIPAAKSPGRPSKFGAPLDFALEKLDHIHEYITREHLALHRSTLPVLDLNLVFDGHDYLKDLVFHAHRFDAVLEVPLDEEVRQ